MQYRLVKIIDKKTDDIFYQIQKKTLLFGWIEIGNRRTGTIGTFISLEKAIKEYDCILNNSYFEVEILK
jgi:hypothetical protein